MTSALSRPITFPDIGLNEQDQDPNIALLDLDRGLKSTKIGEQCEAIAKFPSLFEKYPFPILINSALLKLAEVFRQETPGSNFVRVCVVEVIESCGRHLDKLINVEEFLRRITAVIHSNDPLARALTLRTLGWMSGVMGENRQVHHLIREALDAKDSVELQSAIMAAEKYAAKSKTFAMNMCDRLTKMIGGLATPVDVKLQLIRVFQHMHHDAETAATVRELCLQLLKEYPTQRVVITTLHTLTQLAAHCLVDIPQQVDLLMENLECEARLGVRRAVLEELCYLAEHAPHAWSPENLASLVAFTKASQQPVTTTALDVLATLTSATALPHITLTTECPLLELCRDCCYDTDTTIACKALQVFTNVAIYINEEQKIHSICAEALEANLNILQAVVCVDHESTGGQDPLLEYVPKGLASCLVCAVAIVHSDPSVASNLAQTLVDILITSTLSVQAQHLICEALASLGGNQAEVLAPHLPHFVQLIKQLTTQTPPHPLQNKLMVIMITIVLQIYHCHDWSPEIEGIIKAATKVVSQWDIYRISRQASRYGHHYFASKLYLNLSSRVCSDHQHFWLAALCSMSKGEACAALREDRAENLAKGNAHLLNALSSLKAASTSNQAMNFCLEFVRLRAETLICHSQLLISCLSLRTAPPPAIAASVASSTRDDLIRCGRVSHQLTKSARDFNQLASKYGTLYQSVFDADPQTLCNIALLQQGALLIARAIEVITRPSSGQMTEDFNGPDLTSITNKLGGGDCLEMQSLINALHKGSKLVHKLNQVILEIKPVREQHLELLQSLSQVMTTIPLPYPRLFFQQLQKTNITLNISPQPRSPCDPISVPSSAQLVVKVEGVIGHGRRPGLYRSVQSVSLTVTSVNQSRPPHTMDIKVETNESLIQTVEPHNDFFSAQFLLCFPVSGMYKVTIDASVTDQDMDTWQTGPRHVLAVKCLEDQTKTQTMRTAPQFSGTIPPPALPTNVAQPYAVPRPTA